MNDFPLDYIVADSETDGLRPNVIHMVGVQSLMTGEYRSFVGLDAIAEFAFRIQTEARLVVGHNFNGYDRKVIKTFTTVDIPKDIIVDTVEMSRDLCLLENHKLENWGVIVGLPKLRSPLFERYSPEMDTYCERDVRLNTAAFGMMYRLFLGSRHSNLKFNYEALLRNREALSHSIIG